ncbi:HEPN domain-containing protein [Stenotrophomonas muris]|uniref:HEPN domain-containing protein n=1 Tax=Stenotrophomonas muris TaxID=2963283 RepID=UPI0039C7128C
MTTVSVYRQELGQEIDALSKRFIAPWMPVDPDHTPAMFEHDVKAFCVLAHAAFEEFVEDLTRLAMEEARQAWLAKRFSYATIALLGSYGPYVKISDDEKQPQKRLFDQVREGLNKGVNAHGNVIANNHGFSRPYLRSLFTPIGVDVPEDPDLLQSLQDLANARGSFAHTKAIEAKYGEARAPKNALRPMMPEKAAEAVQRCLLLCDELAKRFEFVLGPASSTGVQPPVTTTQANAPPTQASPVVPAGVAESVFLAGAVVSGETDEDVHLAK